MKKITEINLQNYRKTTIQNSCEHSTSALPTIVICTYFAKRIKTDKRCI